MLYMFGHGRKFGIDGMVLYAAESFSSSGSEVSRVVGWNDGALSGRDQTAENSSRVESRLASFPDLDADFARRVLSAQLAAIVSSDG